MEPQSQESQESQPELASPQKSDRPRQKQRRRRRSSARFLRLTGRLMDDVDEEEEEEEEVVESEQHLGDMYKRAIRMNAENRINASNSWNLRLIENIDKFLGEEQDVESSLTSATDENDDPASSAEGDKRHKPTKEKRVNFTKASCTLDASVKIYSYRVDDVHLTSYKVLANLNRTDNNDGESSKKTSKQKNDVGGTQTFNEGEAIAEDDDDDDVGGPIRSSKRAGTVETNVANINMSKHDSAFDIDPLFHRLSKTFDEGGAKGLLLVNLGVGTKGCNIVFDSKAECQEELHGDAAESKEGMVDISSLLSKLETVEETTSIESMTLVPQLASLRKQYAELKEEGFVEANSGSSKRYASTQEEENEAEMSIHQEAIERSRMSQNNAGRSFATEDDDMDDSAPLFAPDDFGGGGDEGFDSFMPLNEIGGRFSSISFRDSIVSAPNNKLQSQADVLLDAICSGNVLRAGDYEFFDTQALETSIAGNLWAGSAHWKRTEPLRRKKEENTKGLKKKATRSKKTRKKNAPGVDLTGKFAVDDLLRKPPKGKRGSNPLQLSKTLVTKYTKDDNLLPPDSGIGMEQLAGLFLRPKAFLSSLTSNNTKVPPKARKSVCFDAAVETFGGSSFDGGGDDDVAGGCFTFADSVADDSHDDFVTEELKGVRKIDTKSVQVGYATIAKKVDVKRLKKDLWTSIESSLVPKNESHDIVEVEAPPENLPYIDGLSFQDTVSSLEETKTQVDVTLPFYFICILHLANEKGLRLESTGLEDFVIRNDLQVTSPSI